MTNVVRVVLFSLALTQTLGAQSTVAADSLLQRGSLERAESLYYAAVRVRPRDPVARLALGRYLAGRGAARVAVTLFEESIQFGGSPGVVGPELAPLYLYLGDYHALAGLKPPPFNAAELERAKWLEAHPTRIIAPDSVLIVAYRDSNEAGSLGRMPIRINGRIVDALISVHVNGIVVSDSVATALRLRRFTAKSTTRAESEGVPAAADSLGIGRLVVTNYPMQVDTIKTPAIIGIDALGKFAPTFDGGLGTMTLRIAGSVPAGVRGDRFSTWNTASDLRLLQAGGWISIVDSRVVRLLRGKAWTFDAKRGQILVP